MIVDDHFCDLDRKMRDVSLSTMETKPRFYGASAQFGGVATHGLWAVLWSFGSKLMVSNHGIAFHFVIHVLVSFHAPVL